MSDALYMKLYDSLGAEGSALLHYRVCPALSGAISAQLVPELWTPALNRPVQDLIHALVVAHVYHPKNFKNYGLLKYFFVCLIAMGPSYTLRSIVMGEPWAFVYSPTAIPCLLFAMLVSLSLGGLPKRASSTLAILNLMSSVMSVQSGVKSLQGNPKVTALASLLLGTANGSGGLVWNILINAWFGPENLRGQYKWERINKALPGWILLSTVWNVYYWSNCPAGPHIDAAIQYALFFLLVAEVYYSAWTTNAAANPAPSKSTPTTSESNVKKPTKVKAE